MAAAYKSHLKVVALLLDWGANIEAASIVIIVNFAFLLSLSYFFLYYHEAKLP